MSVRWREGDFSPIWLAPQKRNLFQLLSQKEQAFFLWTGAFLFSLFRPESTAAITFRKETRTMAVNKNSLQDLTFRRRASQILVQRARGYEEQARAAAQPRHRQAHDRPGTGRRFLRRTGKAGVQRNRRLHLHSGQNPQFLQNVPSLSAGARLLPGKAAGRPCKDLLQI